MDKNVPAVNHVHTTKGSFGPLVAARGFDAGCQQSIPVAREHGALIDDAESRRVPHSLQLGQGGVGEVERFVTLACLVAVFLLAHKCVRGSATDLAGGEGRVGTNA